MSKLEDVLPELERILARREGYANSETSLIEIEADKLKQLHELFAKPNIAVDSKVHFGSTKLKFAENEDYLNLENPDEFADYIELVTIGQVGITDEIKQEIATSLSALPKQDFVYKTDNIEPAKAEITLSHIKDHISDYGEFDDLEDVRMGLPTEMLAMLQDLSDELNQNPEAKKADLDSARNMILEVSTIYQSDGSPKSHFSDTQIEYMAKIVAGEESFSETHQEVASKPLTPTELPETVSTQKAK